MLILATVSSIGFYISRPQATVAASNNVIERSSPNQEQDIPAQVANKEGLSQTVNGITVEITSTKIISTGIEIGFCYTTLDGGDWYPAPGHLFYGTSEIYPDEGEFTTEIKATANSLGQRCDIVRYRIDDLQNITTPIQFSITRLLAIPREMPACQNFQERLETNPKATAYALKAMCVEKSDGNISVTMVDFDKSVRIDDATKLLDEIAQGVVNGPWGFTINEIEK